MRRANLIEFNWWKVNVDFINRWSDIAMAVSCPEVMYGAYYPYLYGRAGPSRSFYQYERVSWMSIPLMWLINVPNTMVFFICTKEPTEKEKKNYGFHWLIKWGKLFMNNTTIKKTIKTIYSCEFRFQTILCHYCCLWYGVMVVVVVLFFFLMKVNEEFTGGIATTEYFRTRLYR